MLSRRDKIFQTFPDKSGGAYELDPERGYFSVIIPEATTNLVTNPSVENESLTGYTQYGGGSIASTYAWQAFGACGIAVTPVSVTESGVYYGTVSLTAASTYTASIVIQGTPGMKYYIWFATTAGALLGTKREVIANGHKQRIWVTYTETSSTTRRVYVTRDAAHAGTAVFYIDGLQVEAKAYPTTYCDGDQTGFVVGQSAYLWTGTRHASTSTRSAQTRAGGKEVNLLGLGFRVLAIAGLGMTSLVDQSLAIPGLGELYQGTGTQSREFTLAGAVFGDSSRHVQALRSGLIDAFKPDLVTTDQPLVLRYQGFDEDGDACSESVDIVCTYQGGLEGNWDNHNQERLALAFKMHLPLLQNSYYKGVELGFQTTVADADYIFMRTGAGVWQAMAGGMDGGVDALAIAPDGSIYAGGDFHLAGGVANTVHIAKWNGTAWSALGTGMDNGVRALAIAPDGSIYAGGDFHLAGGVANTVHIAKWDGANWTPLGTGMDDIVRALAVAPDGTLYAGGDFHLAGGVANTVHIAKWHGVGLLLEKGMNGEVYALAIAPDGSIYAGGDFHLAGGVANTVHIAKWNGATWSALGTGMDDAVRALAIAPDGSIYAGGDFHLAGGVANTAHIAKWNGVAWSALGTGVNLDVLALTVAPDGTLYAGGGFTIAGGYTLPDRMAIWNGTTWIPMDVDLPGAATVVYTFIIDRSGNLYVGNDATGSAVSATVTAPNVGSAAVYPVITFTGPGKVYQLKNYTTGKAIFFNLTLNAGETATLNLEPTKISFSSTFRSNLLNTILPGSALNFPLLPGANNVSGFIYSGTTAATMMTMCWMERYWSIDGATWQ